MVSIFFSLSEIPRKIAQDPRLQMAPVEPGDIISTFDSRKLFGGLGLAFELAKQTNFVVF